MPQSRQFRDTDPSSRLRRRIAYEKLGEQMEAFKPLREEMKQHSPPECQTYLNGAPYEITRPGSRVEMFFEGARSTLDIPRIRMPPPDAQGPNSADCVALDVPQNQLQMVKYDKAVAERNKLTTLTDKNRFLVSCPSPFETWNLEKELGDYKAASSMLRSDFKRENDFHARRSVLRQNLPSDLSLEERTRRVLKSRGRPSPLREVISIDEDWPQ
ncbi:hypothetical protein CCMA1212_008268 [Trichoderma ghanense]|uniref:Uncharacterized protein n=1 Tax=Trichoderma ghanense TaxID=65468 RepID=A0ABY2GVI9_9HYPO